MPEARGYADSRLSSKPLPVKQYDTEGAGGGQRVKGPAQEFESQPRMRTTHRNGNRVTDLTGLPDCAK